MEKNTTEEVVPEVVETQVVQPEPHEQWYHDEYLRDTKIPVELVGGDILLNPLADHTSAQRLMMFSNHISQAQLVSRPEHPMLMSGYESIIGEYEFDSTERPQREVRVVSCIPKYATVPGTGISYTPSVYVIYKFDDTLGYFTINKHTLRSDGYGYRNQLFNDQIRQLVPGQLIRPDTKFYTSPAHEGSKYKLGTNLNVAYMSIPEATEDAFVISESAAEKLGVVTYKKVSFKILPTQIPLDLYGSDLTEYKFMPDIGEVVREDGVLCALREPTAASIVYDTTEDNLRKIQYLHDTIIYAPAGAEVIDVDVTINRICTVNTPPEVFAQAERYRSAHNECCKAIWDTYQKAKVDIKGLQITPAFSTLLTRSVGTLLVDEVKVPNVDKRRIHLTAVRHKEPIEFIYVTVTYRAQKPCTAGFKISGR